MSYCFGSGWVGWVGVGKVYCVVDEIVDGVVVVGVDVVGC